ncbi:metallophosphatase [Salinimicrobium oceani]|uniref:Twin-arginine translocation signal domain-containing protein n=1 Tax=Salinimicrobium oceani TaxID=2722702 RepID=A0ABX1CT59_9FLAO|nr:metallophosphatase [Salinimicrobium oceani]NJW51470.1 twin-arginine translocation signal domain-containing protein [Salinimicrobium oceani]
MKRRTFLKRSAAAGALAGAGSLGLLSFSSEKTFKHITILHTNDVHSHIDPFDRDHPQFPGMGGVARRFTLIENIRRENPNTLLLDAGDIFQGAPYFNFYGGELEFKLMSKMKYDAATIGNHDFDNGIDGLAAQLPHADFKFLSANYNFKNTILDGQVQPYHVFVKDDIRIGVFGLGIKLEGLVNKNLYKETVYQDPVEMATQTVQKLKENEKCDLVICLSHLGYNYRDETISDMKLASLTRNIDLIIGGHTHTFLPKPTVTNNLDGNNVLVNQVGWAGVNLGRIDFFLDPEGGKNSKGATILV